MKKRKIGIITIISIIILIGGYFSVSQYFQFTPLSSFNELGEKYQGNLEFVENIHDVPDKHYDEIFNFLTKSVWKNSGCFKKAMFPPTCNTIKFNKNGEYSWTAFSDYQERGQSGKWNFILNSLDSGTIRLDNGSVLPFKKWNEELIFGYYTFTPADKINYSPEELIINRNSLSEVTSSYMYFKLIQSPWNKTNDLDLNTSPDLIIFKESGRFFASYRNNQCSHEGVWGLDGHTLISISDPNNCDLRGGSAIIAASNERPTLENDILTFFQNSYYNEGSNLEKKMFIFDRYVKSIKVKGEYSGNFKKNSPITIDFTFQNVDAIDKELGEFTIKLFTCGPPQPNTGCSDTKQNFVITKNYTGILLHPTELHYDSVTIIPPTDGKNYIHFSLNFEDKRQTYRAYNGYVLDIE